MTIAKLEALLERRSRREAPSASSAAHRSIVASLTGASRVHACLARISCRERLQAVAICRYSTREFPTQEARVGSLIAPGGRGGHYTAKFVRRRWRSCGWDYSQRVCLRPRELPGRAARVLISLGDALLERRELKTAGRESPELWPFFACALLFRIKGFPFRQR